MTQPSIPECPYKKGGLHGDPTTPKPNIRPVAQNAPTEKSENAPGKLGKSSGKNLGVNSEKSQTAGRNLENRSLETQGSEAFESSAPHCPCDEDDGYRELYEILTGQSELKGQVHVKVYRVIEVYDVIVPVKSEHPRAAEIEDARSKAVEQVKSGSAQPSVPDLAYLTIAY